MREEDSDLDSEDSDSGCHALNIITINVPLILKMRAIIFFLRANYFMGHFMGHFEGTKTFLTPKLSRALVEKMSTKISCFTSFFAAFMYSMFLPFISQHVIKEY